MLNFSISKGACHGRAWRVKGIMTTEARGIFVSSSFICKPFEFMVR